MDVASVLRHLGEARDLPLDHPDRHHLEHAALSLVRDGQRRRKRERKESRARADGKVLAGTAMGSPDRPVDAPIDEIPDAGFTTLRGTRLCYICKQRYNRVGGLYHRLCPACAADNAARRTARTDLTGRSALITGGRVKIGHHLARKMLDDGARVTITTRFPKDAARRFAASGDWGDRLRIIGIDLRDPREVLALTERLLSEGEPLDILVNNAAQTIRRPDSVYAALIEGERRRPELTTGYGLPDVSGLLPDLSPTNSWSARIGGVDPGELLETHLINAVAPFLLIDRLLPLLLNAPASRRYVINVSAVEGQFTVANKTGRHPHTNMAKAALNMLTRTSAEDLAPQGVYMCSVDTGWITDEQPVPIRDMLDRRTPLDVIDGAARVYDPIVRGEAGHPLYGVFLKDYTVAPW
ncbi:NAD(P)-dependent dehydrogenase, short-chain alcohol dehydrogenase family [Sinosporangium album]|uniref:NAD(P)-dependent dehydrogenase, short-chain alcohol dehydrogenase family n=1 Tax=Sinosporangium album TaxID=504805 RepID=A0A1G8B7S2_9ACTN|nr:SDR family oxidoreductase [Sinosporangium album]SDH29289.1 NAD(P)-dependent dehydrogenase, short-chain alcohol dehydrogenase family [Sinosporangium album]